MGGALAVEVRSPAPLARHRRPRRQLAAMLAGVWTLAFVVRVLPLAVLGGGHAVLEYDDGVHLAAALRLTSGQVPYRDFVFVQPPGVLYLLSPAALVGRFTSEATAMLLARLLTAAVAATTAVLIAVLVARRHPGAGLFAGALYAVWQPEVLSARTVLLEPYLNLALVASVLLIGRSNRRVIGSAVVAAVGSLVKLWFLPLLVVLAVLVLVRLGPRRALLWCLSWAATVVVLLAPYVPVAGGPMWRQVVLAQAHRPGVGPSIAVRLHYLSGFADWSSVQSVVGVRGLAVLGGGLLVLAAVGAVLDPAARWWALLGALALGLVLLAPTFYYHYSAFPSAPLIVAVGLGLAALLRQRPRWTEPAAALGVGVLVLSAVSSLQHYWGSDVPAQLRTAVASARCPWAENASIAVALGVSRNDCNTLIDPVGYALQTSSSARTAPVLTDASVTPTSPQVQRVLRAELAASDAVVLARRQPRPWDAANGRYFDANFRQQLSAGDYVLYRPR